MTIRQLQDKPEDLAGWRAVPFPSPLHSNLDYVYTVDQDTGTLTISCWNEVDGMLRPTAAQLDLASIYQTSVLPFDRFSLRPATPDPSSVTESDEVKPAAPISGKLLINFGFPGPMNELQAQFFTDLVFVWRFYIDDPLTWRYDSSVFSVLCIALLRLAAWDFEVSTDSNPELPVNFASIPQWTYPKMDIYWFHGFLVVLQANIESDAMIAQAVLKAKSYIRQSRPEPYKVHSIIISPRHVAFVEFSHDTILSTGSLILLENISATRCSPGFRALARVLTSGCWERPRTRREKWQVSVPPPELMQIIIQQLEPRDAVAFAQASPAAERCYYASLPQFPAMKVRSFRMSVPCCGRRGGLEESGVCCSKCLAWQHLECTGLKDQPIGEDYTCMDCRGGEICTTFDPGGINRDSCRKARIGCQVQVGGTVKSLQLRLSKPSHLRPELRLLRNLIPIPPSLVDYTILFNRTFCGLAYGLEDTA